MLALILAGTEAQAQTWDDVRAVARETPVRIFKTGDKWAQTLARETPVANSVTIRLARVE